MRPICTVLAALVALLVGAGYAAAEPSGGPASQALSQGLGQAAASGQAAGALSGASQTQPSNGNTSVRVLSPGDNGDVRQSNSVSSSSTAANANGTDQSADQNGGSCGCAGTQAIDQQASNDQAAHALSLAGQTGASNGNVSVRVASPGDNGSVGQSNSVDSGATAANLNGTHQDADQDGGAGTQAIGQEAKNDQSAGAASLANQVGASNGNVSVRVLSPGDDGHVSQSNSVDSDATAANLNGTHQDADQDAGKSDCGCPGGIQAIGQEAKNDQSAGALSAAGQIGASNSNISVRVASPGDNGSVRQSNSVDSDATAANLNGTEQDADQDGGSGVQAIGQTAVATRRRSGVGRVPDRRVQQQHARPRREPGTRRARVAVEQRRLRRHGREPEPDQSGRGPGRRQGVRLPRRRRHPGDRPGSQERAGRAGRLTRRARGRLRLRLGWEHERTRARGQQGRRRLRPPVEQRRLRRDRDQRERDEAGRGPGQRRLGMQLSRRRRHPGDRPGGQEQAVRDRAVGRDPGRGVERQHAGLGRRQGPRREEARRRLWLRHEQPRQGSRQEGQGRAASRSRITSTRARRPPT